MKNKLWFVLLIVIVSISFASVVSAHSVSITSATGSSPGGTVKVYTQSYDDAGKPLMGDTLNLKVKNSAGTVVYEAEAVIGDTGAHSWSIPVNEDCPTGSYTVEVYSIVQGHEGNTAKATITIKLWWKFWKSCRGSKYFSDCNINKGSIIPVRD